MSWVIPPGMAARALSASAADFGCFARNVSCIGIVSPSYPIQLAADLCAPILRLEHGAAEKGDEPGVGLERQPIDGRFRTSGDAIDGITRRPEPTVDGLPLEAHAGFVALLGRAVLEPEDRRAQIRRELDRV